VPILYYAILGRVDTNWKVAAETTSAGWSGWIALATMAPLLVPALVAYASPPATFLAAAIRVWPLAVVAVVLLSGALRTGGFTLHVLLGISVPLAVLAVQGVQMIPLVGGVAPRAIAVVLLVLLAPPLIHQLDQVHDVVHNSLRVKADGTRADARFINPGERDALDWLRNDHRQGGVMTYAYLGALVPGVTGRSTYVGNGYWSGGSTGFFFANGAVGAMLSGASSIAESRMLIRRTRVRFILASCAKHVDLARRLPDTVRHARRFGCADVFVVRAS
jgi:hypothetical protein